jgi:hypothetical protein
MKTIRVKIILVLIAIFALACTQQDQNLSSDSSSLTNLVQTSGQLASGTSFVITGSAPSSTSASSIQPSSGNGGRQHGRGGCKNELLNGTSFIATTDELAAIVDAESAGDMRGFRMFNKSGATVTHYDASGNVVTLPIPDQNSGAPEGASFSGKQFPKYDSLLSKIAKTVVDFGAGVTITRGNNSVTRSGSITITRTGTTTNKTETVTYSNYKVNGILIEGTKTRVSTFDSATGNGTSNTTVTDGKITLADGTVATWTSTRTRSSSVVLDSNGRPTSGEIKTEANSSVKLSDGTVIYSNVTTAPVVEKIECRRHAPVSGTVTTIYRTDTVVLDFGDGSCSNNTVSVTVNGVTTIKTIGR